jgi:Tol biopolymer transport system component
MKDQLAFSLSNNGRMYVLDFPFLEDDLIEVPAAESSSSVPLSWSPDGELLLFYSVQTENKTLSLWDGKNIINILEYHGTIDEVAWSFDGRLAFTEFYGFDPGTTDEWGSSEVFYWDGNAVVSLSQNPRGEDRFPAWNRDGEVAFLSARNGEYDVLVWDGVSKDKGLPDSNTFVNVAPNLVQDFSSPTWTSTNSLTFGAGSDTDSHVQIYEWNGSTAVNISRNPMSHNGGQTWRSDGYWSFITFLSGSQDLYIRDAANQTVLKTRGQYSPAWSPDGALIFCVPGDDKWTLSMWRDENVIEVAAGGFIIGMWKNGDAIFCSYG